MLQRDCLCSIDGTLKNLNDLEGVMTQSTVRPTSVSFEEQVQRLVDIAQYHDRVGYFLELAQQAQHSLKSSAPFPRIQRNQGLLVLDGLQAHLLVPERSHISWSSGSYSVTGKSLTLGPLSPPFAPFFEGGYLHNNNVQVEERVVDQIFEPGQITGVLVLSPERTKSALNLAYELKNTLNPLQRT